VTPSLTAKTTGNKRIAVDTNVLVASIYLRDKWHAKAVALLSELDKREFVPIYFDCVMNEGISIISRRLEEQGRIDELPATMSQLLTEVPESEITWISKEIQRLYQDIVDMVQQTNGALNFHDGLIALCCKELDVQFILSFDQDFDSQL
jgi:predicted nucleic acid-binding protein